MKKIIVIIFVVISLILFFLFKESIYSLNLFSMDTFFEIKIKSTKYKSIKIFKEVEQLIKDYHDLANRYEENDFKNIYYINEVLENDKYLKIDKRLREMIEYGIKGYEISDGLVNIALGNVIDIWKSYQDEQTGIPTLQELDKENINIKDIKIKGNKIKKKNNVKLDLGSIAKGIVVEKVGDYLEANKVSKYIINGGGNVLVGEHFSNKLYKVGIENPLKENEVYQVLNVKNTSLVTSGSNHRFYTYQGKKYHHIIDPITKFPPQHMASVTVITKSSSLADLLSTYLFLIDIEKGLDYVNSQDGLEAIWYGLDNKIYKSKGISKYE